MRDNRTAVIPKRRTIVGFYKGGQGTHQVSRCMGINRKTVLRWLRRYQEEGNAKTRHRSGRSKVTSAENDRQLVEAAEQNLLQMAAALTQDVEISELL